MGFHVMNAIKHLLEKIARLDISFYTLGTSSGIVIYAKRDTTQKKIMRNTFERTKV